MRYFVTNDDFKISNEKNSNFSYWLLFISKL